MIFNLHLIFNSLSHFKRSKITDLATCTGILVNKDTTSKESIKSLSLILKLYILSINSNEFFIDKLLEFIKGVNIFAINLERLYKGELIKEKKKKNLRDNTNIVITKADKGNCTVIIDKDKYEEKIFKLLNDKDTYVLIKNDLTKNIEGKLNKFIFDLYKIDRLSQKEYFYLRSTDAIVPRIYGLPKIHKPDWPLRPIVSFINSPLYNLSKFMAKILTPLIHSNNLSIKNSFKLIDKIYNFKINDNDLMLSFDVVSLFTKIPVHVAKSVIFKRLKCDSELKIRCKLNINEIMNALDIC